MPTKTRSRAPKRRSRPLSPERIVAAALKLADDTGDFSMRALGAHLRVDPMAIYRHFRDKDALRSAMVEEVLVGFEAPPQDFGPPVERLREMCRGLRVAISKHPGIGLRASTTLLNVSPHSLELTEAAIGLLVEIGLDHGEAARAYTTLMRFVSGVAAAQDQLRADGQSEDELQEAMRAAYSSVSRDAFPHVFEIAEALAASRFDEQFEFGIDALLVGFVANAHGTPERERRSEADEGGGRV
jgi:TetR/AcrR family tetracycline transcriptional repressor